MKTHPIFLLCLFLTALSACQPASPTRTLRLATTTSTLDSGLMAAILPNFEARYDVTVDVIGVGTGEALALGRAGDVDVVLVHARELEEEFVAAGYGINRQDVMVNDFVILGPAADPAGIGGMTDAAAALAQIAATEAPFISRGDQSGTHVRELQLWQWAGVPPAGDWYQPAGQGQGATLTVADQQQAYLLTDRGTYLKRLDEGLDLALLVEGDPRLRNLYGVIAVNPARHEGVAAELAQRFIGWITSVDTQAAIEAYRVNGRQLFQAAATRTP